MYQDNEQLEQYKSIWLTKETYMILKKEQQKLKKEDRKVSMAKILNNLVLTIFNN